MTQVDVLIIGAGAAGLFCAGVAAQQGLNVLLLDHYPKVAFAKKAIGIVTVSSGAMGGMRAAMHLQQFILALWAIPSPQMLLVSSVQNKFDEQGHLLDENYTKNIDTFLDEFLWLAKALKNAR